MSCIKQTKNKNVMLEVGRMIAIEARLVANEWNKNPDKLNAEITVLKSTGGYLHGINIRGEILEDPSDTSKLVGQIEKILKRYDVEHETFVMFHKNGVSIRIPYF